MKTTLKTLSLAVLAVSAMATSPAFADTKDPIVDNETHQAYHQSMHGDSSSPMMGGSMTHGTMMSHSGMGSHQGTMGNMMNGNHGMAAKMYGAMANGNVDCPYATKVDRDLSVDDARNILEAHLVWKDNKRLKVGKVEADGDRTYIAEILTVDNSLVEEITVDKNTGAMSRK